MDTVSLRPSRVFDEGATAIMVMRTLLRVRWIQHPGRYPQRAASEPPCDCRDQQSGHDSET